MNDEKFKNITGFTPQEYFGFDDEQWEEEREECFNEFLEDSEYYHDGHERGGCFNCKMD